MRGDLVELDRHELAGVVDPIGRRYRIPTRAAAYLAGDLAVREQSAAALTVVGSLVVDEAALGAVQCHLALTRL